jgi:hypothetical protein
VAENRPQRSGLRSPGRTRLAIEANRTQHSCGLRRLRPEGPSGCAREPALAGPGTQAFPDSPPFKKRLAHAPKGVSRSARLAAGADRPGERSWVLRSRLGGGWEDLGMATSQARLTGTAHAEPVRPPTHYPTATIVKTTAVELFGRGRRPFKASRCLGGPGPQWRSRCSLDGGASLGLARGGSRSASARRPPRGSMAQEFLDIKDLLFVE